MGVIAGIIFCVCIVVVPLGFCLFFFWIAKWAWIVIGIIIGNQEVVGTIKKSTCESMKKKDESWISWFERTLDFMPEENKGLRQRGGYRPNYRNDASYTGWGLPGEGTYRPRQPKGRQYRAPPEPPRSSKKDDWSDLV